MSRWIEVDMLVEKAESVLDEHKTMWFDAVSVNNIYTAPSIDLVFCEECIHSDWHKDINGEWRCYCAEHGSGGHKADDFCSYGCRKEGE